RASNVMYDQTRYPIPLEVPQQITPARAEDCLLLIDSFFPDKLGPFFFLCGQGRFVAAFVPGS
ncbi:MAG: hypothetical protein WBW56_15415, partial [Syntrophobacteraceae bacterium]